MVKGVPWTRTATVMPARALTAAGQRLDLTASTRGKKRAAGQDWQRDAWAYRDAIGEIGYAIRYLRHAVARCIVTPHLAAPGGGPPTPLGEAEETVPPSVLAAAEEALGWLTGHTGQWGALLSPLAENFEIAGEAYLVGREDPDRGEVWETRSVQELEQGSKGWTLKETPGDKGLALNQQSTWIARLWVPHPQYRGLADSPMRGLLEPCEELQLVARHIRGASRSRLAGAGLLMVPNEMEFNVVGQADLAAGAGLLDVLMETMSTAIADEGDASSQVPVLIKANGEHLDKVRHLSLATPVDEKLLNRQEGALRRIGAGLDVPPEIITGMADVNHWCVDDRTEVLTADGWVTQDQLRPGDAVLTLNHDTGLSEWQPVRDIYRAAVVDEPMVLMDGRNHSSLTTPNHRWATTRAAQKDHRPFVAREFVHTEDLTEAHSIPTAAPCADLPDLAKHDDAMVELVGWFWTEGNVRGRIASIAQSHTRNPGRVASIRAALTRLYGPGVGCTRGLSYPAWRETTQANVQSHGGPVTVFHLNQHATAPLLAAAPGKVVREQWVRELTRAQLELFIDISAQGDGWHYRDGQLDIWQKRRDVLAGYELALILSGRMVSTTQTEDGWCVTPWKQTSVRPVKAARARTDTGMRITPATYTGVVWCPVTANTTWLARRDGKVYFTGNSAWAIDASTIRNHVEPLLATMLDAITAAYLRPTLLEMGVPEEWARRVIAWYDVTPLTKKVDRAADAKTGWDAMVISNAALVEALGFDPSDMPDPAEIAQRMATQHGQMDGALTEGVLRLLYPLLDISRIVAPGQVTVHTGEDAQDADPPQILPGEVAPAPAAAPAGKDVQPAPADDGEPDSTPGAPITSAGTPDDDGPVLRAYPRESRRLMDIDRALRDRLTGVADAAMSRALERAGNRARTLANRTPETRELATLHRGSDLVPALIAAGLDEQAGVDVADLVDGVWQDVERAWTSELDAARIDVASTVDQIAPAPVTAAGITDLLDRLSHAAADGLAWLLEQLRADLTRRLTTGDPDRDAVGEAVTPSLGRLSALVRAALALAGGLPGSSGGVRDDGRPADPGQVLGGPGTGTLVAEHLRQLGRDPVGYEWVYGISVRHFEPHRALDGLLVGDFDSPLLTNPAGPDGWPGPVLTPGDHAGCQCDLSLVWADSTRSADVLEAAGAASYDRTYLTVIEAIADGDDRAGRTNTSAQQTRDEARRIADVRPSKRGTP